jgi:hypothetical protein
VTLGNGLILELEGEVDCPFPNKAVMIMKYFFGLKVLSSPMSHSLSAIALDIHQRGSLKVTGDIQPEYQEG